MSAAAKRLQLSSDQRAILEAVYAIEKLPDATLRERLSSYLTLSARKVQARARPPAIKGPSPTGRGARLRLAPSRDLGS